MERCREGMTVLFPADCSFYSGMYQDASFSDTMPLQQYLQQRRNTEDQQVDYRFETICDIVDAYADFRSLAEADCHKTGFQMVKDRKRALPVPLHEIEQYFESRNDSKEPPASLIVTIAEKYYEQILRLSQSLHNVLRSKREKIPLERVQQTDSQCLRWLTRQPGRTVIEKAGERQSVLAIVRYQSLNTLENRVFKQFLRLCINEGRRYIQRYGEKYAKSNRIGVVRRLVSAMENILLMPAMESIARLSGSVVPNYVLQNNPVYRSIWDLYLQMLHRTTMLEVVWKNRQKCFREFVRIMLEVALDAASQGNTLFASPLWVDLEPNVADGKVLHETTWRGCYNTTRYQYETGKDPLSIRKTALSGFSGSTSLQIHIAYIPEFVQYVKLQDMKLYQIGILYFESKKTILIGSSPRIRKYYPSPDFRENLFNDLRRFLVD